jgi:hypothetical protein
VAAVVASGVVVAAVGIGGWITGAAPGEPCATDYPGKRNSDVCADSGGTVSMDNLTVSATPLAATDGEAGGIVMCSSITLTNNTDAKQDYNAADFTVRDPSGESSPPDSTPIGGTLQSGALGPGGTKTGTICDERPVRRGLYAVTYEPSLFGDQRGVWLSQH